MLGRLLHHAITTTPTAMFNAPTLGNVIHLKMKTKMKQKELYEKVALLKDGQVVQIAGDFFRAVQLVSVESMPACMQCDLDSICHDDVLDVCSEMESTGSRHWILKLAHPL